MADEKTDTVLVVDDTEANVDILVEILDSDYDVSVALEGETALEIANTEQPDIILLDIMMPGIDGYEVCRRLKANAKTKDIPVIFVTAMGEAQDETKGFDLGAVDYITKPINPAIVEARVASVLNLKKKTEELKELSQKLSKYLAPQVYVSIFKGEHDAEITSKRKKLTIYFSDIVGFTETTEGMESEDLSALLNDYLEEMSNIAIKFGGTIDKFIGDAILVFFGDPLSGGLKEDADACLSMAIEMRDTLARLQKRWYDFGIENPFRIRAGISTGYCTVGNFGCSSRMDYTIIGSPVNIASRLQHTGDPDDIIIGHETWALVKDLVHCEKKDPIVVKGISHPIQSYKVIDFSDRISAEDAGEPAISGLLQPAVRIGSEATLEEAKNMLASGNPHGVLVVTDNEKPEGIITSRLVPDASAKKPDVAAVDAITSVMDASPLVVESLTPLNDVAEKILAREVNKIYDHVVVVEDGNLRGIVPVYSVFQAVANRGGPDTSQKGQL